MRELRSGGSGEGQRGVTRRGKGRRRGKATKGACEEGKGDEHREMGGSGRSSGSRRTVGRRRRPADRELEVTGLEKGGQVGRTRGRGKEVAALWTREDDDSGRGASLLPLAMQGRRRGSRAMASGGGDGNEEKRERGCEGDGGVGLGLEQLGGPAGWA